MDEATQAGILALQLLLPVRTISACVVRVLGSSVGLSCQEIGRRGERLWWIRAAWKCSLLVFATVVLGKVHTLAPPVDSACSRQAKRHAVHSGAVDLAYGSVDSAYGRKRQINGLRELSRGLCLGI